MATAVDFWNDVDRRIETARQEVLNMLGAESIPGAGQGGGSAGWLPMHGNAHHEPRLALASDLSAHVVLVADAVTLGHVKGGGNVLIAGDGTLSVDLSDYLTETEADMLYAPLAHTHDASAIISGTLIETRGGTGHGSYTVGDLLYADTATTLARRAGVVAGNALISGGVGAAPTWGKIGLATHVSGTLSLSNGGLGFNSIAADLMIYSTAIDTLGTTSLTAFARTLLDDASAAVARSTLGLDAGGAGDIWVEKAGDTMTGALILSLATGSSFVVDTDTFVIDATNNRVGVGTTAPLARFDIGGLFSPAGVLSAEMLLSEDINNVTGMEFRNINTGTLADSRFAVSDTTGHYLAFAMPSVGNTGSNIFGLARPDAVFIFGSLGGTVRHMAIGPSADKDLILGTNNLQRLRLTNDGRIFASAIHNNAGAVTGTTNQYIASGTYTPALTGVANVGASAAYECQWIRVGNVVTVSGKVDVDPTAAAATQLGIALPIASNLAAAQDCAGVASAPGVAGQCAAILGDAANNRAELQWIAVNLTNQAWYFQFMYEVL